MGVGEGSGAGCGSGCLKCILVILNIVFGLIGFAILAVGVFIYVGLDKIANVGLASQLGIINEMMSELLLQNYASLPDTAELKLSVMLDGLGIPFLVIGGFLFLTAIFGCCGSCCSNKGCLVIYVIICTVLFSVQVILIGLFFGGKLEGVVQKQIQTLINDKYGGIDDFQAISLGFNFIMAKFQCCGISDYKDFEKATSWKNPRKFDVSKVPGIKDLRDVTLTTPLACCKFQGTFPKIGEPIDNNCATYATPKAVSSNFDKGCWSEINTYLKQYKNTALGALVGVIVAQFAIIVVAICIIRCDDSEKAGVV